MIARYPTALQTASGGDSEGELLTMVRYANAAFLHYSIRGRVARSSYMIGKLNVIIISLLCLLLRTSVYMNTHF